MLEGAGFLTIFAQKPRFEELIPNERGFFLMLFSMIFRIHSQRLRYLDRSDRLSFHFPRIFKNL